MAEKTVPFRSKERTPSSQEVTRSQERCITPLADIYETEDGLVVKADLPGVSKDGLDIRVANNVLTIRATTNHAPPGDPLYREFELVNFFRQFELSDRVDQAKIEAELKHGVLTLTLPKAEEAKPKKIQVQVA